MGAGLLLLFVTINVGLEYFAVLQVFWIFLGLAVGPAFSSQWRPRFSAAIVLAIVLLAGLPFLASLFLASQRVVYGRELLESGRADEALKVYSASAALDPLSFEARRGLARGYYLQYTSSKDPADLHKALAAQEEAIRLNRLSGKLWAEMEFYWDAAGDQKKAGEALYKSILYEKGGLFSPNAF